MQTITQETLSEFMDRFCCFNDALIRSVKYEFLKKQKKTTITLSAKDEEVQGGWSNVEVVICQVAEFVFREGNATCQVLSDGLTIKWFDHRIWCDFSPYASDPETVEDFRQSDLYVVGASAMWEAGPYSDE